MDLRNTQLKDTYGNLVTTGTTAGSPTTGGLQNGQGTLLTSVGIGTNDPSTELEVGGSSNTQVLISSTTNTGNSQLYFGDSDSDTAGVILYRHNGDSMAFEVNDAERLRIDSSGNVGIGTTDPQAILNNFSASARGIAIENGYPLIALSDTGNSSFKSYIGTDSGELYVWNAATGPTVFATNNTERMRIDSSGNVGINCSPSTKLHLYESGSTSIYSRIQNGNNSLYLGLESGGIAQVSSDLSSLKILANTYTSFETAGSERMRIGSGGDISFRDGSASEAFYWDASTARLGIGTTEPGTVLDIHGAGNVLHVGTGTDVAQYMSFRGSGASGAYIGYDGTGMLLQAGDGKSLRIKGGNATFNSGSTGLEIDTSGNVGIGVSPLAKLHVNDTTYPSLRLSTATSYSNIYHDGTTGSITYSADDGNAIAGSSHQFFVDGSSAMIINSSGKVGIGTDTVLGSATRLHVKVDDSNTDFSLGTPYHLLIENDNTTTNTGAMLGLRADTADGGIALHYGGSANVGYMTFHVDAGGGANGERMRIDSSGNVGIGCSPSAKLDVDSGSTQTVSVFKASSTSTATNNGGALIGIKNTNDTDGNMEGLFFQNSNGNSTSGIIGYNVNHSTNEGLMTFGVRNSSGTFSEKMRIDGSGKVGIGTDSPTAGLECVNTFGEIVARSSQASSTNTSLRFMGGAYTGNKATAILLDGVSGENRLNLGGGTSLGEPATEIRFHTGTAGTLASGSERMRIDSSGNVGISSISPDATLTLGSNSVTGDTMRIKMHRGGSTSQYTELKYAGNFVINGSGNDLVMQREGSEVARFTSDGICFGGDFATANALDDYEEGTWTPAFTTSGTGFTSVTYDSAFTGGKYTKIGDLVHIQGAIMTDAITVGSASGNIQIAGLPFATSVSINGRDGFISLSVGVAVDFAGDHPVTMYGGANLSSIIPMTRNTANGATNNLVVADLDTGANKNIIYFAGTYKS
jgi:hypothetical protein